MADKPIMRFQGSLNVAATKAEVQRQLDTIGKSLKLTIGVSKGGTSEISNQTKEVTKQKTQLSMAEKVAKQYAASVNEIAHAYKTQQVTADMALQKMNQLRVSQEFKNASDKTQLQLMNSMISAERTYTKVSDARRKVPPQNLTTWKELDVLEKKSIANQQRAEIERKKEIALVEQYTMRIREMQNATVKTSEGLGKYRMSSSQKTEMQDTLKASNALNPAIAKNSTELKAMATQAEVASRGMRDLKSSVTASGKSALKFSEYLKNSAIAFSLWISVTTVFFRAVRAIKSGIDAVIELDTQLTSLKKVTSLTDDQMEQFSNSARDLGATIDATTATVVEAAAAFARMGFSAEKSLDLAKEAIILKNVSEGMDSISESTSVLISTLKGFQLEASKATMVVDSINIVGNKFAVTNSDIAEGIKRTASILSASGASFEQTIGLLTSMIEVSQNAEKSSTALRTLSLRIQGLTEDGDSLGTNFVAKFNKDFEKIAGVSITVDGKLRNVYDIVTDLGSVWKTLSKEQQIYLATESVGIRQAGEFVNLLNNYKTAIKATETALNSQGSALVENEKYMKSIQGRIDNLARTFENLWTNAINSESVKIIVDLGASILRMVDSIGLLNVVLGTTVLIFSALKFETLKVSIMALSETITGLGIAASVTVPQLLIIGAAVAGLIFVVSQLGDEEAKHKKQLDSVTSSLKTLKGTQEELKKEYESGNLALKERIDTLSSLIKVEEARQKLLEKAVAQDSANKALLSAQRTITDYKANLENLINMENSGNIGESYDKLTIKTESMKVELLDAIIALEKLKETTGSLTTNQSIWLQRLKEITGSLDQVTNSQKDFLKSQEDTLGTLRKTNEALGVQYLSLEDLKKVGTDFVGILESMADGQELNGLEILELLETYPELIDYIDETGKLTITQTELESTLWEAKKEAAKNEVLLNQELAQSKIDQLNEMLAGYKNYFSTLSHIFNTVSGADPLSPLNAITNMIPEDIKKKGAGAVESFYSGIQAEIDKEQIKLKKTNIQLANMDKLKISDFSTKTDKSSKSTNILDQFKSQQKAVEDLNHELTILSDKISIAEGQDKIDLQNQQIQLYKDQQEAVHQYSLAIREAASSYTTLDEAGLLVANSKATKEQIANIEEYNSQLQKNGEEWWSINSSIKSIGESIKTDVANALKEQQELIKKSEDAVKELREMISDMVKQELQDQIDNAEEQVKKAKELLDIKLKQIEAEKDLADFSKDKAEKETNISKIITKINSLQTAANQGDMKAQNEIKQLEEDRKKAQEELDELINDRSYELRKENLENQYDLFEDEKKDEIDEFKKQLNNASNITMQVDARLQDYLSNSSNTLYNSLISWNKEYGTSFDNDVISKWQNAIGYIEKYNQALNGGSFSVANFDGGLATNVKDSFEYWIGQKGSNAPTQSTIDWMKTGNLSDEDKTKAIDWLKKYGKIYDNGGEFRKGDIALKETSDTEFILNNKGLNGVVQNALSNFTNSMINSPTPSFSSNLSQNNPINITFNGTTPTDQNINKITTAIKESIGSQASRDILSSARLRGLKNGVRPI